MYGIDQRIANEFWTEAAAADTIRTVRCPGTWQIVGGNELMSVI